MSQVKISALTEATSANLGDFLVINQGGTTKKIRQDNLYAKQVADAMAAVDMAANSVLDSHNVSSVSFVSTGEITMNLSTAMLDANYAVATAAGEDSGGNPRIASVRDQKTGSYTLHVYDSAGNFVDAKRAHSAAFGGI